MLKQLRYSGVFEAVTIRKSGYPFRLRLDHFVAWYKCLLLDASELRHFHIPPFRSAELQAHAPHSAPHSAAPQHGHAARHAVQHAARRTA